MSGIIIFDEVIRTSFSFFKGKLGLSSFFSVTRCCEGANGADEHLGLLL
jgi:hypothetical protein